MVCYTDTALEKLWEVLEDVTLIEDAEGLLVLNSDWHIFDSGCHIEEIWSWFDENHSKGVNYLNEM